MRTAIILASALFATACGSDPTAPGNSALIGRFGDPALHAELIAIHAGAELLLPCGSYFAATSPLILDAGQQFSLSGKYYPQPFGLPSGPQAATITGRYANDSVQLQLHTTGGGEDPATYQLARDASGNLDMILCALTEHGAAAAR